MYRVLFVANIDRRVTRHNFPSRDSNQTWHTLFGLEHLCMQGFALDRMLGIAHIAAAVNHRINENSAHSTIALR